MKKYYVVYYGIYLSDETIIGSCTKITDKKIKTYRDIVELQESIKSDFHFKTVVILNYRRIKL